MVTRVTSTDGRFAMEPIEGALRPGAEISIYTRKGELVGKGMVHSVYDDDLYVDAIDSIDAPKDKVEAGFVVLMNYSAWDAAKYIRAMQGTLANAALETQEEANRMCREIADESRTNLANREKWQEEMTKLRMELDYQYPSYYPPYYWGG